MTDSEFIEYLYRRASKERERPVLSLADSDREFFWSEITHIIDAHRRELKNVG